MFNLMLWFLLLVGWFELLQPSLEFGGNMLVKMKTVSGSVAVGDGFILLSLWKMIHLNISYSFVDHNLLLIVISFSF